MIGTTISHYKILEVIGEGGMGILCPAQDVKLNRVSRFQSSPKGIDIPTEGTALGSDLPSTITTLKGLDT
jgi:hypothetical protein